MGKSRPVLRALLAADARLFWPVVGGLVIAAALLARLIYGLHSASALEAAAMGGELAFHRDAVARIGELDRRGSEARARLEKAERGLLAARADGSGVAALHEAFRACAARSGISISSGRALPGKAQGSYTRIPAEFQFRADVGQLRELLSRMQGSPVMMGMKGIRIKTMGAGEPGRLDVTMVVEAAMRPAPGAR